MINLPESYLNEIKELFKDEYDAYIESLSHRHMNGLRVNTNKISVEDFLSICPFKLERIPWTDDGFYFNEEDRLSKHPYYYAGLYYIQEPSAMLPAQSLPVEENDVVLDACAAPGGKSLKLANKLNNTGLLLSNDISVSRAQILLSNIEKQGIKNCFVVAEDLSKLDRFNNTFDKILLDAPCSATGTLRRHPEIVHLKKEKDVLRQAALQKQFLGKISNVLKKGGILLYCTCSLCKEEGENQIKDFLQNNSEYKIIRLLYMLAVIMLSVFISLRFTESMMWN